MIRRPLRIRLAWLLVRALNWLCRHTPRRVNGWLIGDNYWDPRIGRWIGATVCRTLGHTWYGPIGGDRKLPVMLMCEGCTTFIVSDDADQFASDRDGRDAFAAVLTAILPADDPAAAVEALEETQRRYSRAVYLLHWMLHGDVSCGDSRVRAERFLFEELGARCSCSAVRR